jgi:hypothetical protein
MDGPMDVAVAEIDTADQLVLTLHVTDRDIVSELLKRETPEEQERFALAALRVGVLAIRQATGVVDAQSVEQECDRFLHLIQGALEQHASTVSTGMGTLLGKFFDPQNGEFQRRLDRLICKDGELENLLANHLNGEGSALSRTLQRHIGENSPLLQLLTPDQKKGLLGALLESVQGILTQHSRGIVSQFSLDDKQSALSRLLAEVGEKNGDLRKALTNDLDHVRKEFSLDNQDGALARLVDRVEVANKTILLEFSADNEQSALRKLSRLLESTSENIDTSLSLDDEKSPLSRLRGELLKVITDLSRTQADFQEHVRTTLETLQVRKKEAARSTTHGLDFESAVGDFLSQECQRLGDALEPTSTIPGVIARSKVGDYVAVLSPESAFPGARIVFEAKDVKGFTIKNARDEIKTARENRDASVGVFVCSRTNAPANLEPLSRWGQDVFVIWDVEDASTDVYLKAAMSIARALVIQHEKAKSEQTVCIFEMDNAVSELTQDIQLLNKIQDSARHCKTHAETIGKTTDTLREKVNKQLDTLRTHVAGLQKKPAIGALGGASERLL